MHAKAPCSPLPPDAPIALWAFLKPREAAYRAFARLLICDPQAAADTVDLALAEVSSAWDADIASAPNSSKSAWEVVRRRILAHADPLGPAAIRAGRLRSQWDGPSADIALMAQELGMDEQRISEVTGRALTDVTRDLYLPRRPAGSSRAAGPAPDGAQAFITNWHEPLLAYTLTWCGHHDHAEQQLLDAITTVLGSWPALLDHAAPAAPAFRILRDTVRRATLDCPPAHTALDAPLAHALSVIGARAPDQADALRLRHLVCLDYPRTAALLGTTAPTARHLTWTALRALDTLLREGTADHEPR